MTFLIRNNSSMDCLQPKSQSALLQSQGRGVLHGSDIVMVLCRYLLHRKLVEVSINNKLRKDGIII